ncbi:type II toxin-antitoxin system Phd/YefM family antitoxin [Peptoniphilus ovalis]|uniref:type II toxin-antitoxin system Phd/YefM family antitoxin n=1 Tax=Peptoniphilus ovalis TaxID=2841503 RepID=UPI001FE38299|nr:type II toxin-antitoxin system Phd/YefM family antitoxin [Peptoniphilus ovalis]
MTLNKIVLKNNTPECVLLSPEEYSKLIEDAEDARDLLLANERLSNNYKDKLISQEDFEKT